MQITPAEIAETLAMVNKQNLDIRTITLGLNLRGCAASDVHIVATKVYDRMTSAAEKLVPTARLLQHNRIGSRLFAQFSGRFLLWNLMTLYAVAWRCMI